MNIVKLFETQRILDERIEKEHPLIDGEDRLSKKLLALQVELGELANEWRGFKFWSNDQEPRTNRFAPGVADSYNYNPLLEEYVDCLHFILSIGLEIDRNDFEYLSDHDYKAHDITNQFMRTMDYAIGLREDDYYADLLYSFIYLGEMLGFTWEQVVDAYYAKNQVNHERQNTGY